MVMPQQKMEWKHVTVQYHEYDMVECITGVDIFVYIGNNSPFAILYHLYFCLS